VYGLDVERGLCADRHSWRRPPCRLPELS
jgi:hypothetical protein